MSCGRTGSTTLRTSAIAHAIAHSRCVAATGTRIQGAEKVGLSRARSGSRVRQLSSELVEVDVREIVQRNWLHLPELAILIDAAQFDVVPGAHRLLVGVARPNRLLAGHRAIQSLLRAVADRESILEVAP